MERTIDNCDGVWPELRCGKQQKREAARVKRENTYTALSMVCDPEEALMCSVSMRM